jgi:hypothetical protein
MSDDVQNKNSASENDLGTVHRMVNDGYKMKLGKALKSAKKKKNPDEIPLSVLQAAGGWCRYNKVVGKAAVDEELGAVVDELEEMRRKNRGNQCTAVGED